MKKIEKFIFIVTYGRSGSTLLMQILNTIDGADIKGENANTLFPLFQSYKRSCTTKEYINKKSSLVSHPWYGVNDIDPERYARRLAKVFIDEIINPAEKARVIGFKEIRYPDIANRDTLEEYIGFIRRFFPNSYIIFNKRNLEDVLKSGWWKNWPMEKVMAKLEPFDRWMQTYHSEHPDFTYIISYDDYKDDSDAFRGMFEFLGEEMDEVKVRDAMSKKLLHLK